MVKLLEKCTQKRKLEQAESEMWSITSSRSLPNILLRHNTYCFLWSYVPISVMVVVLYCRVNTKGEAMLANLNHTAHLHYDGVFY